MENLERLKKVRTSRPTVTRTINEMKTLLAATPPSPDQLKSKLSFLETKSSALTQLNSQVQEMLAEDQLEADCEACDRYLESIVDISVQDNIFLSSLNPVQPPPPPSSVSPQQAAVPSPQSLPVLCDNVSLPKLKIDPFNGNLSRWQSFWDQFKANIHDNGRLSTVNKMKYLVSLLTGSAARSIDGLAITNANYATAIAILQQRFGKDELLVSKHLDALFDLKPVRSVDDIKGLRALHEAVTTRIRNLQALSLPLSQYSVAVHRALIRKIPKEIELDYYRQKSSELTPNAGSEASSPDLESLMAFLEKELECRERVRSAGISNDDDSRRHKRGASPLPASASALTAAVMETCILCKSNDHRLEACTSSLSASEIKDILRKERRCFLCSKQSHFSKNCRVCRNLRCQRCGRRHLTQLCLGSNPGHQQPPYSSSLTSSVATTGSPEGVPLPPSAAAGVTPTAASTTPLTAASSIAMGVHSRSTVLLQTAVARVDGGNGQNQLARVLLDGGSQRSFIRRDVSDKLGCKTLRFEVLRISTLGKDTGRRTRYRCVQVALQNRLTARCVLIEAIEYDHICSDSLPFLSCDKTDQLKGMGLQLADEPFAPSFCGISVLIGSDYYWKVVTGATIRLSDDLVAAETVFGWTVQGVGFPSKTRDGPVDVMCIGVGTEEEADNIDKRLQRFWELEHLGITDDPPCELEHESVLHDFYSKARLEEGRYTVRLPWKSAHQEELGDNKKLALKRLRALTKKLICDETLMQEYDTTIRQYLLNNHAERVLEPAVVSGPLYYMPHHAVIRRERQTTKVRVVFDASSKSPGCASLNECLHAGPNLNPDVLELLLQFRTYPVALTADIEKAFLQIVLDEADRDSLRFLWYSAAPTSSDPCPEMETWRMTRVPFGAKSSSFLLAATIRHHLQSASNRYPATTALLASHFYVDDLVVGLDSVSEALALYHQARDILQEAGMKLLKWSSNDPTLQHGFHENGTASSAATTEKGVLGLCWDISTDELRYSVKSLSDFLKSRTDTKRYVLQAVSRVYDPLGYVAPYVITAKILLQNIWLRRVPWDDRLPEDLMTVWLAWCQDVALLYRISVPRKMTTGTAATQASCTLHIFSDASPRAYGAVVYLLSRRDSGVVESTIVLAKARVAPVKTISLPRLKLMAAVVAARLLKYIRTCLSFTDTEVFLWTDSEITLAWISATPFKWKPFVQNRVSEIHTITDPRQWRH